VALSSLAAELKFLNAKSMGKVNRVMVKMAAPTPKTAQIGAHNQMGKTAARFLFFWFCACFAIYSSDRVVQRS
jgi:hypothetical protein